MNSALITYANVNQVMYTIIKQIFANIRDAKLTSIVIDSMESKYAITTVTVNARHTTQLIPTLNSVTQQLVCFVHSILIALNMAIIISFASTTRVSVIPITSWTILTVLVVIIRVIMTTTVKSMTIIGFAIIIDVNAILAIEKIISTKNVIILSHPIFGGFGCFR
jgi:hypothetical protein